MIGLVYHPYSDQLFESSFLQLTGYRRLLCQTKESQLGGSLTVKVCLTSRAATECHLVELTSGKECIKSLSLVTMLSVVNFCRLFTLAFVGTRIAMVEEAVNSSFFSYFLSKSGEIPGCLGS